MQTAWPPLPELNALGQQPVAAPVLGAMGLGVAEPRLGGLEQTDQLVTIRNHLALRRGPGSDPAA